MSIDWKRLTFTAVLATATAFAQNPVPPPTPDAPVAPPTEPQPEAPAKPKLKQRERADRRLYMNPHAPRVYSFSEGAPSSYLGVSVHEVTQDRLAALKLKDEHGVEITGVDQDGPAAKAGIREHDVILTFNGQNVESYEQLRRMIRETPAGRPAKLGLSRDGQPVSVNVTMGKRSDWAPEIGKIEIPHIEMPPMDFEMGSFSMLPAPSRSGMTVEDLTPQLREFFGVRNGEGVLVRSVERGSAADAAGIRAGDIVVKINNERVSNSSEWRRLMRQQRTGNVAVGIVRDKREHSLSLKVPERKSSDASTFQIDIPEINIDMNEIADEIRQIQPRVERGTRIAMASLQKTLREQHKNFQKELDRALRDMDRAMDEQERELRKQQ